jgi:hypothetical protein
VKALAYISALLASALMLVGVYHKPLGLPEDSDIYFFMAGGVCLIAFYVFQHRARLQGDHSAPPPPRNWLQRTWADRSKRFWFALVVVAPLAIAGPFLAPYTGSALSFRQEVITSAISFILFIAIVWFASRRREASSSGLPRFGIIMIALAIIFLFGALFFKR